MVVLFGYEEGGIVLVKEKLICRDTAMNRKETCVLNPLNAVVYESHN